MRIQEDRLKGVPGVKKDKVAKRNRKKKKGTRDKRIKVIPNKKIKVRKIILK